MMQFTASDGIRLAYDITDFTDPWTEPATLILLHAVIGSSRRFYTIVPPLCRRYRVARMDLRGHGHSDVRLPPKVGAQHLNAATDRTGKGPVRVVNLDLPGAMPRVTTAT